MIEVHYKDSSVENEKWDGYVNSHPMATVYHLSNWQRIFEQTYNLNSKYLMAKRSETACKTIDKGNEKNNCISGILPLFHMKSFLFGNSLVSLPFVDYAGLLYSDQKSQLALINKAIELKERLNVQKIEFRQNYQDSGFTKIIRETGLDFNCNTNKVSMKLKLMNTSEDMMKSYKSKLRSQIKSSFKKGLRTEIGSINLLDDFYKVFSINMRDLGSPVHSKAIVRNMLTEFPKTSRLFVVYKNDTPLACSAVVGYRKTLENPWASSLKKYSRLNANMQLYWKMLEYGCDNGYENFNFGRSSKDQGTYKFKKQWGAEPSNLYWNEQMNNNDRISRDLYQDDPKDKLGVFIRLWQRLPVPIACILGPIIRKRISL